jgi:hypothetical protein
MDGSPNQITLFSSPHSHNITTVHTTVHTGLARSLSLSLDHNRDRDRDRDRDHEWREMGLSRQTWLGHFDQCNRSVWP